MKKNFYLFSVIAVICYVMAVIIGGLLVPGYSHINQAISEIDPLIDKQYRIIITILFGIYNVFAMIYGILLFMIIKEKKAVNKVQALSIVIISLCGILMYFFPMDVVGTPVTTVGIMHIVLAAIIAPLTITTCFLGFFTFKGNHNMRIYSLVTSIVITVCGGASAIFVANSIAGLGILERITIGSYILWLLITSIYLKKKVNI